MDIKKINISKEEVIKHLYSCIKKDIQCDDLPAIRIEYFGTFLVRTGKLKNLNERNYSEHIKNLYNDRISSLAKRAVTRKRGTY